MTARLWPVAIGLVVLLALSRIAGVTVGATSAQAGWWLIVVSGALLVLLLVSRSGAQP
jgi:hypothetical protein